MALNKITGIVFCAFFFYVAAYDPAEFKKNAIFAHNKARSQHVDTSDLTWDDNLASSSSKYATTLMLKNLRSTNPSPSFYQMPHSADNVGENIYMGHNGQYSYTERTVMDAVSAWYGEGVGYNYYQFAPFGRYWHFTQVVWKETTKFGCGSASYNKFNRKYTVIVCQYLAKGNISVGFLRNVKQLKSGGKSRLSAAELTAPRVRGGPCTYTDDPSAGCPGMKDYCNDEYLKDFMHGSCKKTCFC